MNKIMIADDHPIFLKGIQEVIKSWDNYQIVGTATNGEELLKICNNTKADIILIDYNMPLQNGIESLCKLKKITKAKIVILTYVIDEWLVTNAKENGAAGLINKTADEETLYQKLNAILNGELIFPTETEIFNTLYAPLKNKFNLTTQETFLMKDLNEGLETEEISSKRFLSEHTVLTHKKNLFLKLGVKKMTNLLMIIKKNISR